MERKKEGIPVLVNMASMASYDGMTDDPIQVITTGTLFPKKEYLLLRYTENQEDEATGEVMESEIHLVMKKNQVTMNRMGQFANTMLFQPNRRYETVFRTPYGDLPMAVQTREVRCNLGEENGNVHLKYEISMQGAYASTNELHLEYRVNEPADGGKV